MDIFQSRKDSSSDALQLLRVGIVSSVDEEKATARVRFEDRDDMVTHNLKIVVPHTMKTKNYWIPDVDETVLCCFLQNGIETGFILGSVYSEKDNPPVKDKNKKGVWFEDGTYIEYDLISKKLSLKAVNPIKIEGDVEIEGNLSVKGELLT